MIEASIPKKRGRKPKQQTQPDVPNIPKKRGRKPRGGKIITVTENININELQDTNVIVHLKCKKKDLNETDNNSLTLEYNTLNQSEKNYNHIDESKDVKGIKTIHDKLKQLQLNLHNNNICETNSSCFWCTYNFTNLPISIPKFEINNTYHVYGCFCTPECACAYLMNENLSASIKFERYHLLNYIYGKIYNYENNIKPAPNPHYLLDKFYGNLSIEEYRSLFDYDNHLFIISKPITRELPELHSEYKEINKINYKNKKEIVTKTFGL